MTNRRVFLMLLAFPVLAGCRVNPFDVRQQPVVLASVADATLVFRWSPAGAQLLRVYRGDRAGDGYGEALVWSVAAESTNSIVQPVTYARLPAGALLDVQPRPLVSGERYTVEVTRADPRGRGEGFTSTHNRYVGTAVFSAP
jgi:hypothetical protein